jgi:filamentous hemagglutinin family protein
MNFRFQFRGRAQKFSATRKSLWLAALLLAGRDSCSFANPTGMAVVSGFGNAQQIGSQLNVTVSQMAMLNWKSFNIQVGETTAFLQPSANSIVFNEIGGANPSQIFGNLNANGTVILANANGFYFGPNSMISVGGSFIATTAPLTPDFGAGSAWQFTGMPPLASIVNYGQIKVGAGKSLYLIAEQIDNQGQLAAPGGDVGLYAGESVLVSERPDGRGLSATMKVPGGSVNNFGQITADAGTIALQAQVVNQNGILQADSVQNQNGVIELVASDSLTLGADSQILARGDGSTSDSSGGSVTLKSGNNFSDSAGSQIITIGGAQGGSGGNIEISAPNVLSLDSSMDATAQNGFVGGEFLLDPVNIILGTSTAGGAINVNTAFAGFSTILLQATGNITVNANTTWNLSSSTGNQAGQLTLEAAGDITFGGKSQIFDANNWSVTLAAGYNFANNTINSGIGNIYLNGGSGLTTSGSIQTAGGDINLFAGQSILLASQNNHSKNIASGSVFTTGGGSIFAYAEAGNIDAGTSNGGTSSTTQTSDYNFTDTGATPNPFLGGISTAAGGNVTLIAGNNIDSTPVVPSGKWPGASGTYGAGDVTIIAGNQINGNYMLANGVGTMLAGVSVQSGQAGVLQNPTANPTAYAATLTALETTVMQSQNGNGNIGGVEYAGGPNSAVTLGLVAGSWNAWAANNIFLKEVNNPNGTFNSLQSYLYNYAPDAAANFWAGNGIELAGGTVGGTLSRVPRGNQNIIYAPSLSLNAGAGGIQIDKSIILAPSSEGSLSIVTRDGGNLTGVGTASSTTLTGITMSDSGSPAYTTFGTGHAATPLHLNDPNPVTLDISGSINSFGLTVPTFAAINVAGNTYNFGFAGQNLSPSQTTSINVVGNITYRGDLTTVPLTDALPSSLFNLSLSADPDATSKLIYNATTGTLTFIGVMTAAELAFLLNPSVVVLDANGQPVLDANGNPVTASLSLDATQKAVLQQLYTASLTASLGDQGLALAGPGNFNITASGIDLGISGGISVIAPDSALAAISPYGANLNVTTTGDLTMTSTKIANESLLGGITLNVGGTLDVGGEFTTFGDPSSPKGIFTTSGGNISVTANENVNVNGSRIATYDGGNIDVKSLTGDVDAGAGGAGYVTLQALQLDPVTQQLVGIPATIPGSGILATTVVGSDAALGNITVNTPNGSINASSGGILQIAFNDTDTRNNFIDMNAGLDIIATGSGVIGANVNLHAGRTLSGLIVGKYTVNASAKTIDPTAILFGPQVGYQSDGGPGPTVISDNPVSENGNLVTAITLPDVASAPTQVAQTAADATAVASTTDDETLNDNGLKGGKKPITLAQRVGRVTVLLPGKKE